MIGRIGCRQVTGERAEDHHKGIQTGVQYRQSALGFQERRQPEKHREVTGHHAGDHQAGEHRGLQQSGRKDLQEVAAAFHRLRPGGAVHLGLLQVAPDVEHQQCRKNPGPEHRPPRQLFRQHGIQQQKKQVRHSPAHRPSALHRAHRLAAVLRADHFPDQHRTDRPLAAEAQALQRARDQQLFEGVGESAEKGKKCEPGDGQLKNAHAAESVRQHASQPASDRRTDDRRGGDPARFDLRHAPHRNQGGHDVSENHDIDRVGRPTPDRGDQRLALPPVQLLQPCEHMPLPRSTVPFRMIRPGRNSDQFNGREYEGRLCRCVVFPDPHLRWFKTA